MSRLFVGADSDDLMQEASDMDASPLGSFFAMCQRDLCDFLRTNFSPIQLASTDLKIDKLNLLLEAIDKPFIFVLYAHGNKQSIFLRSSGEYIILADSNTSLFRDSFVYTWSCESGYALGPILIRDGAQLFVGYRDKVWVAIGRHIQVFVELANLVFKEFAAGNTIQNSSLVLRNKFNLFIDQMVDLGGFDILVANVLRHNRDSFTVIGNNSLSIHSFLQ